MPANDPQEEGERVEAYRKGIENEQFLEALNAAMAVASLQNRSPGVDVKQTPLIYVIGVPRSGTTLLSQLFSRYLPVGYINNLTARFWRRPSVGIRLAQILLGAEGRRLIDFKSRYGTTDGIAGPHEFGYFWRHWFKLDEAPSHHLSQDSLAKIDREGLQNALEQEILTEFNAPVVFKNVICGFQASLLTSVHPASLFVHIRRDPFSSAASILRSRLARYGTFDNWWSLKPSTYPSLAGIADPVEQVAKQVTDCMQEFNTALAQPGVNSMQVEFDDVWQHPTRVLEALCDKLGSSGTQIEPVSDPVAEFSPPQTEQLPVSIERQLRLRFR